MRYYGKSSENPAGTPEDIRHCISKVADGSAQCSRYRIAALRSGLVLENSNLCHQHRAMLRKGKKLDIPFDE